MIILPPLALFFIIVQYFWKVVQYHDSIALRYKAFINIPLIYVGNYVSLDNMISTIKKNNLFYKKK